MAKNMEKRKEMTVDEAKAYRASLYKRVEPILQEHQKREQFRQFWAENRNSYGKKKNLEDVLWVHLKATKLDDPSKFEEGIRNFGLKKLGKEK